MDKIPLPPFRYFHAGRRLTRCQADDDDYCDWKHCPQSQVMDALAVQSRGAASRYLTDAMKRALVSDAVLGIMLARYDVEGEKAEHTDPNLYVDVALVAWKAIEE